MNSEKYKRHEFHLPGHPRFVSTVTVEMLALYIFAHNSRIPTIRENRSSLKITYIMPYRGNNIKSANMNPHKIASLKEIAKTYTHEKWLKRSDLGGGGGKWGGGRGKGGGGSGGKWGGEPPKTSMWCNCTGRKLVSICNLYDN